jgi:Protein kinase domain
MEKQGGTQNFMYSSKSSAAAKLKIISRNSGVAEKKTNPSKLLVETQLNYRYPEALMSMSTTRTQGFSIAPGMSPSPRTFRINQPKKSIPLLIPGMSTSSHMTDLSISNVYANPDNSLNVRKPVIGIQAQERFHSGIPGSPALSGFFASSSPRGSEANTSANIASSKIHGMLSSSKTSKLLDTRDGLDDKYQTSLQKYLIMKPNKMGREVSPPSRAVYAPSPNTTQTGPSMLASLVNTPLEISEQGNEKLKQLVRVKTDKISAFMPEIKQQVSPRTSNKQGSLLPKENALKIPTDMGNSPISTVRMKIEIKPRVIEELNNRNKQEIQDLKQGVASKMATKKEPGAVSQLFFGRSGSYDNTSNPVGQLKESPRLMHAKDQSGQLTVQEKQAPAQDIVAAAPVKLESGSICKPAPREESTLPSPSRAQRFHIKWSASSWPKIEDEIRVDKLLGQGSFAKVYQGFDLVRKIIVAIKVLDKRKISELGFNKMAEKELEVLQQVKHPHIGNFERMLEDKNRVVISSSAGLHTDGTLRWNDSESVLQDSAEQEAQR